MESVSLIDLGIVIIIIASTFFGAFRGIVRTLFALLAAVIALAASLIFTGKLASYFPYHDAYPVLTTLCAFVLIFVGVLVLVSLPGGVAAKILNASGMRFVDRSLGFVFGFLRGGVIVLAILWVVNLIPSAHTLFAQSHSFLLPYFLKCLDALKSLS
ncbi:MAG: CvpA family protein [Burkholderiales bacterium]|jgi:membrane protein required for colicin V production|nr:CvpA family protein [Burkholderiales bacterium]